MKNKLSFLIAPAVFCWCLFYLQGCKEPDIEDTQLGGLNLVRDTLDLKVTNEFAPAVVTSNISGGAILGNLVDPTFGKTSGSFYSQYLLRSNNIFFGDPGGLVLDSAILAIYSDGRFGKFTDPVDLQVYELDQSLVSSTNYYSNTNLQDKPTLIGPSIGGSFLPSTDSVRVYGKVYAPHIRIPLTKAFGESLLFADSATLSNNTSFQSKFKGVHVTTGPSLTGNGLLYLDLQSSLSKIILYYRNGSTDSLYEEFPLSGGIAVNRFDNNYAGTPVFTSVNSPNPNGEETMYIQGGSGVRGKIEFPDISSIPANAAINKAELILTRLSNDTLYSAPRIELLRVDGTKQGKVLDDEAIYSSWGSPFTETVNGVAYRRYSFNIKFFFQKLIKGIYGNDGFYLESYYPSTTSERVIIGNSSTDKNYQVTLVVTYTKL